LLCNETRATDWLLDLMVRGGSTQALRQWLFAPRRPALARRAVVSPATAMT
jgi:hypothetical protein